MKRVRRWLLVIGLIAAGLAAVGEIVARQYVPPMPVSEQVGLIRTMTWSPYPSVMEDRVLGYRNRPGKYQIGYAGTKSTAEHDAWGNRITSGPGGVVVPEGAPELWLFGCTMTYGGYVDDEKTYPYQLQQWMPKVRVVNFGGQAYGDLQCLLWLEEALKRRGPPAHVVLGYTNMHPPRNCMTRAWQRIFWLLVQPEQIQQTGRPYKQLPFARLNADQQLEIDYMVPRNAPFPGEEQSSLLTMLDLGLTLGDEWHRSPREVTRGVVDRFRRVCDEHHSAVTVAVLENEGSVSFLEDGQHRLIDASVSVSDSLRMPVIGYPNALGYQQAATKMLLYFAGWTVRGGPEREGYLEPVSAATGDLPPTWSFRGAKELPKVASLDFARRFPAVVGQEVGLQMRVRALGEDCALGLFWPGADGDPSRAQWVPLTSQWTSITKVALANEAVVANEVVVRLLGDLSKIEFEVPRLSVDGEPVSSPLPTVLN